MARFIGVSGVRPAAVPGSTDDDGHGLSCGAKAQELANCRALSNMRSQGLCSLSFHSVGRQLS
jgi:hypothetical protein